MKLLLTIRPNRFPAYLRMPCLPFAASLSRSAKSASEAQKTVSFLIASFLLFPFPVPSGAAPDESTEPPANLEVMRNLAEKIASEVALQALGQVSDTVSVTVHPEETAWYLETSLLAGLGPDSRVLTVGGKGPIAAEFSVNSLEVEYSDARKSSVLGSTILTRRVGVNVTAKVVSHRTDVILLAREFSEHHVDTVEISQIAGLENPNIPVTHASLPSEGFFTNLVEPLVVLGAIGVAVFLLFHVRS